MIAIGYSGLKRNVALAALIASTVSGCASVEYTSQAELNATHTVVPLPKPDSTQVGYATVPGDTTTAVATASNALVSTPTSKQVAALNAQTQTVAGGQAIAASQTVTATQAVTQTDAAAGQSLSAAYAEMPLTAEMMAIQSVIPTPKPGEALAYASAQPMSSLTPQPIASLTAQPMDSLASFDTSPLSVPVVPEVETSSNPLHGLISKYAKLYEVPEALVHRVVRRESTYNPKAYHSGNFGLMQIRYNTAKSMGYDGPASGLFDAETNLRYAVKYLRGAWLVADNNNDNAVRLYARGYYYDAKRKGMLDQVQ